MGVSLVVRMPSRGARPIRPLAAVGSLVALLLLPAIGIGCQTQKTAQHTQRLIEHQALVDFSGLKSVETHDELKVTAAPPRQWTVMPAQKTALYQHQQWKSPSGRTGVGVAYVRLPLPVGEKAVLWLAKQEYTKKADDGRLINEWVDELGRHWFEAENNKYHLRGYALCKGFSAWIVYFGHKITFPPDPAEISLAARAAETIVPMTGDRATGADESPSPPTSQPAKPPAVTAEAK